MAEQDFSVWTEIGKAVAYVVTGAGGLLGTIWGAKSFRKPKPMNDASLGGAELERVKSDLAALTTTVNQNAALLSAQIESSADIKESVKRVHERIDEMARDLNQVVGYIKAKQEK